MTLPSSTNEPDNRARGNAAGSVQLAPKSGEPVRLLMSASPGYVDSVVAYWTARRCWDVVILDATLHVRNAAIRGMNLGGPPWQEVER